MKIKGNIAINYIKDTFSLQIVDEYDNVIKDSIAYNMYYEDGTPYSYKNSYKHLHFSNIVVNFKFCNEFVTSYEDVRISYSTENYITI